MGDFLDDALKPPKPKKRKPPDSRSMFERSLNEACARLDQLRGGDQAAFDDAGPEVFVGLYAMFHTHVYGIAPSELTIGAAFLGARSAVVKLLAEEFGGQALELVDFIRWVWNRERMAEKKRGADSVFRIGWRLQFCHRALVVDYRVHLGRAGRVR